MFTRKNFSEVSARSLSSNEVEYSHLNPVQQKDRQKQKDTIDQIAYEMSQEIKEKKVSEESFQVASNQKNKRTFFIACDK